MTSISRSWDERYRRAPAPTEPSALLLQFSALLPPGGLALDLACGAGRNSLFLAERGLRVVGVDSSEQALEQGRELARRRGLRIAWVRADLERFSLPPANLDVIVCFYYRDPALFAPMRDWLRRGGLLLYETFTREQLRFDHGPRNPAHLLEPGELLGAFGDWDLIFYRETSTESGVATLVARKPELRP